MKFLDEYRAAAPVQSLRTHLQKIVTRPWTIMEVCGGQTHSILRYGLDELLPAGLELVHGPGCPVCVTAAETLDRVHAIAALPDVIFCSFGDMLRVPGSRTDLLQLKAGGSDVRIVYSPLDAVNTASANPGKRVVYFAIGFETTAPANATALLQARSRGLHNFSTLVAHVLVPPALRAVVSAPNNRVQAFLGPGHVCTVTGTAEYEEFVRDFHVPVVVTGFEPLDLLEGIYLAVRQLEAGDARVDNQYRRAAGARGNAVALQRIAEVFEVCDRTWRGLGHIPKSGWRLRAEFSRFDAEQIFNIETPTAAAPTTCISGAILQGQKKPIDCPEFGGRCTPLTPMGATMVSDEGACAAYYAAGRRCTATGAR